MNKNQQIVEHIIVTFFQAALAYVAVLPHPTLNKAVLAGAVGAGLSAAYNLLRQSQPTIPPTSTLPPLTAVTSTPVPDPFLVKPEVAASTDAEINKVVN